MHTTQSTSWEYLDQDSLEIIVDLMEGDAEMIIDLIDTLMDSSPELLDEIREGIHSSDSSRIREASHALKSSNAQLGALIFSGLCAEMEQMGKTNDLVNAENLYTKIIAEYEKVDLALQSWKDRVRTT